MVASMIGSALASAFTLLTISGDTSGLDGSGWAPLETDRSTRTRLAVFDPAEAGKGAFYVSPAGNDGGPGSRAQPFATIGRAQAAMEAGPYRATVIESGTYELPSTLALTEADSGEIYVAAAGEQPVIEGSSTVSTLVSLQGASGITFKHLTFANSGASGNALFLSGSNGNTIVANQFVNDGTALVLAAGSSSNLVSGNTFLNSALSAVEAKDGSNSNLFDSNLINGTGAPDTFGGGFYLHGVNTNTISHNLVENTAGMGIGVLNWDDTTINIGNVVTENIVRYTDTISTDSGAIYVLGRSQANTQMVISNNLIEYSGSPLVHSVGVYLDDSTSGATVTGNILRDMGSDSIQIHGGSYNTIRNNIVDLGSGSPSGVLFQAAPANTNPNNAQIDNVVTQNIFYSSSTAPKIYYWIDGGSPTITGNLYFNTTGTPMTTSPPTQDTNPFFGNPLFMNPAKCDYTLQAGSAASLIGFVPINQSAMGLHPTTPYWY